MFILSWVHGRLPCLLLRRGIGEVNRERRDLGHHLLAFLKRRHCLVRQKRTLVAQALARELVQVQVRSTALAP